MTTLTPRPPYSRDELRSLYPTNLELKQVQVIFRHGERTPVSPRFQSTGLAPYWPYCHAASRFVAAVLAPNADWDMLPFSRRLDTFGPKNEPTALATGPNGEIDGLCTLGELTDRGRETTLELGQRLRNLYVDQLGFLPQDLETPDKYYLRATPIVRALESLQQVFTGMYPVLHRASATLPIIHTRSPQDEITFPNDANCRRFAQLSRAFGDLAAQKWNGSPEMAYLQKKLGKHVDGPIAVDGHPRLSGVMDTVNATLAHGPETKLPAEFHDPEVRRILNMVNVDEWYRGYSESSEYRKLGVGGMIGDIKDRAMSVVNNKSSINLALIGCHDTTLAGILASLGCFDNIWPPFTSSIAVETFRLREKRSWFSSLWTSREEGWFVRMRYNDKPIVLKACRKEGRHLKGDESFCTMEAFREVAQRLTPRDWKGECAVIGARGEIPPLEEVPE